MSDLTANPTPALLSADLIALIDKGVSVIVSACSLAMRPSIMRAVGSSITPDGSSVTVYLSRRQSRTLLQDIASTSRLAVVFSEPTSHRTLQLKARNARIRNAVPEDATVLARYLTSMEREIAQVGFDAVLVQAMLSHHLDDVVAISFEPAEAFDQTPGPRAGAPLLQAAPNLAQEQSPGG
ncbi:MAG: hypothetical protein Q8M51_01070 [Polaromonas sp.]|uniref:hypothetical protein n=1 Tax=Polaromonas sp. TaxID=1869339 RepID=UPI0027316672|nr:hypothetical protein [Polaromonas sp.]MDP1741361.1 hypothetical protein [Polaromonas sp.]MDP1955132.1 hypothetical protein [Polaromonas sp.]MDP3354440.1 hypothetical protein [Polaromonas sp.]MDP3752083.1 hypothetical protein [Polaromonas sp.]